MAGFGNIFGRLSSLFTAGAVGGAAADSVAPVLRAVEQHANAQRAIRVLDPDTAARAVTRLPNDPVDFEDDAKRSGVGQARFDVLRRLGITYPESAELLELWRRGELSQADVHAALTRQGYDPTYINAVVKLFTGRLDPAVIATAIQRGVMTDPGFLPVGPPTAAGNVKAFPVSPLDPIAEAQAAGIDAQRLFVETALVGLPLSLQAAASAYFRGIITLSDFQRAVSEGNTRNEWGDAALEQARQIITAGQAVEARLRGWLTDPQMYHETARHGMSQADTDLLFKLQGRPPSWHQIWIGLQRGGTYDGPLTGIDPAFLKGLQESDLRPEWYNLLWHSRYTYPSAFVLRSLTQAHDITQVEAETILTYIGWEPVLAKTVSTKWAGGVGAKADPHIAKAETQLWNTIHSSYKAEEIDAATATAALPSAGVAPTSIPAILAAWDVERNLIRATLSAVDIRKAYQKQDVNVATGLAWTRQDAVTRLLALGYNQQDADNYLDIG